MMQILRVLLLSLSLGLAAGQAVASESVDINQADALTLSSVMDGVGPSRAAAIVQYRDENGPFTAVDDLMKVKGIGAAILERNRAKLVALDPKLKLDN